MLYNSTLNKDKKVTSAQAIAQGIADDGGLFVPEVFPEISDNEMKELLNGDYKSRAKLIFGKYLTDFTYDEIDECVEKAYTAEKFESENPAPLHRCTYNGNDINVLELWHGPTSAFKDMALQILPHLITKSLKKTYDGKEAVILVATSGDTGKAALEGFKDVDGTKIIVFYPESGVSPIQKHQMCTQEGKNVCVCAIKGNFDDAQTGVKTIFTDDNMKDKLAHNNMLFSSANSINWGRLLPQIVYYFSAYCELVKCGRISLGDKVNITVPTGNFGNILASYYAYRMGLPVNKFICASNSNDVLTEFINTGVYNKNRDFYTTTSPSMDILVSSNLERFLYHITGSDDRLVKEWMTSLKQNGNYDVGCDIKEKISDLFYGGSCDDNATKSTIAELYKEDNYLCDTHTAVAINVYNQYVIKTNDKTPCILASTASPYKFCKTVLSACAPEIKTDSDEFAMTELLNKVTDVKIPQPIAELKGKEKRFDNSIEKSDMADFILKSLGVSLV
ncbi:MAG: threonine synthase [Clostridia bacterium]|nr:threonine synthase [Clostridia bacterium]